MGVDNFILVWVIQVVQQVGHPYMLDHNLQDAYANKLWLWEFIIVSKWKYVFTLYCSLLLLSPAKFELVVSGVNHDCEITAMDGFLVADVLASQMVAPHFAKMADE